MSAPTLALMEEQRAEGLAARIVTISSTPDHPSAPVLALYRESARLAFEAAAEFAEQPGEWPS